MINSMSTTIDCATRNEPLKVSTSQHADCIANKEVLNSDSRSTSVAENTSLVTPRATVPTTSTLSTEGISPNVDSKLPVHLDPAAPNIQGTMLPILSSDLGCTIEEERIKGNPRRVSRSPQANSSPSYEIDCKSNYGDRNTAEQATDSVLIGNTSIGSGDVAPNNLDSVMVHCVDENNDSESKRYVSDLADPISDTSRSDWESKRIEADRSISIDRCQEDTVVDITPGQIAKPPVVKSYDSDSSDDDLSIASLLDPMKPARRNVIKPELPVSCDSKPVARLKSSKNEYDYDESDDEPCAGNKRSRSGSRKRASLDHSRLKSKKQGKPKAVNKANLAERLRLRRRASSTLTSEDMEALKTIDKVEDKALQVLLWKLGLRFTLLNHQFEGCRGVAGVPENFPFHAGVVTKPTNITLDVALQGLKEPTTQGLLLADDMGLGKTIQAISGSFLHSGIRKATKKHPLPTFIVCPNVALIEQWKNELRLNGVSRDSILFVKNRKQLGSGGFSRCYNFIFMTRYTLQAECKDIMTECDKQSRPQRTKSSLFPSIGVSILRKFSTLHRASTGKEREHVWFRKERENYDDCSSRILASEVRDRKVRPCFGLLIIDEAHFLKNRVSYWGIGASLLGVHSSRTIAMTGTPYCNGGSDMAALQSYIQIDHEAARTKWWDGAEKAGARSTSFASEVAEWRNEFLIRRRKEEILKDILPEKTVTEVQVQSYPAELFVYDSIESKLRKLMETFAADDEDALHNAELANMVMAYFSLARESIIHPILPHGREITIQFSPSRCHLAGQQIKTEACVCCSQLHRPAIPLTVTAKADDDEESLEGDYGPGIDLDLQDTNDNDNVVRFRGRKRKNERNKGPFVRVPPLYCQKYDKDSDVGHYVHEKCLKNFEESSPTRCPRCEDLERRVNIAMDGGKSTVPHRRYCKHIMGGFVASSKIENVIRRFEEIPEGDKVRFAYPVDLKGKASPVQSSLNIFENFICSLHCNIVRR